MSHENANAAGQADSGAGATAFIQFVRACYNLAASAHEHNAALTNQECEMVITWIQTLPKNVLSPHAEEGQRVAAALGAIPPIID